MVASWLPKRFEFLSGLPAPARKRRRVVMIQAWVDDSGGKGQTEHQIFASVAMAAEQWAEFSDQWAEALAGPVPIHFFKFDHALNRTHAFRKTRMTVWQRD